MISKDSLITAFNRASRNVQEEGITDVNLVQRPFEVDFLRNKVFNNKVRQEIVSCIKKNNFDELVVGIPHHILIPKKTLADFRSCAVLDIRDELIYLTLVLSLAKCIEENRINKSKKIIYSYRFKFNDQTGCLFDPSFSMSSFQSRITDLKSKEENKVMVSCDIACFYDRLNLHRLNSTLLSLPNIDNDIVELIDQLLLFWSGRNSYGLPVGSNASRILAEAELIEVDNYLMGKNIKFCRFVDDYRIFARDASEANEHLERLVYALNREGLFLNSGKTKIEDISSADNRNIENIKPDNFNKEENPTTKSPFVIAGYSGLIPLKYRKPSSSEIEKLKALNIEEHLLKMESAVLLDASEFRNLVKAMEVQNIFKHLSKIVKLIERCPQFVPYIVDFCQKRYRDIDSKTREDIVIYFKPVMLDNETPEYIRVAIAKLYSSEGYSRIDLLTKAFLGLTRESGEYLGRALLDCLAGHTTRLQTLDLRDNGSTVDISEIRALSRAVIRGLPIAESAPFLKNLRIRHNDLFLAQTIEDEKLRLRNLENE